MSIDKCKKIKDQISVYMYMYRFYVPKYVLTYLLIFFAADNSTLASESERDTETETDADSVIDRSV